MDEMIETELAKGGIMPWQFHDSFCFAFRAVHTQWIIRAARDECKLLCAYDNGVSYPMKSKQ